MSKKLGDNPLSRRKIAANTVRAMYRRRMRVRISSRRSLKKKLASGPRSKNQKLQRKQRIKKKK